MTWWKKSWKRPSAQAPRPLFPGPDLALYHVPLDGDPPRAGQHEADGNRHQEQFELVAAYKPPWRLYYSSGKDHLYRKQYRGYPGHKAGQKESPAHHFKYAYRYRKFSGYPDACEKTGSAGRIGKFRQSMRDKAAPASILIGRGPKVASFVFIQPTPRLDYKNNT